MTTQSNDLYAASETRPLSTNVVEVEVSGSADIHIRQDKEFSLVVSTNRSEDLSRLMTDIRERRLYIYQKSPLHSTSIATFGRKGSKTIQSFSSGVNIGGRPIAGGVIILNGQIVQNQVDHIPFKVNITLPLLSVLEISGAGNVLYENVDQKKLEVECSGAGDIKLHGRARTLEVSIAGAGDLRAKKFEAEEVRISISGAGDARVYASKSIRVRVSGAGDVDVYGGPEKRDVKVTGAGDIDFH